MPRASAAMSSRFPPMPASFWNAWKSPRWRISTASHPPSPSGRRTPAGIRESMVATSTECYDFLRLLFARVGRTFCPNCGTRVERDTVDQVAGRLLALPAGSRWYALFPVSTEAHPNTQALRDHLFDLRKKGFNRL